MNSCIRNASVLRFFAIDTRKTPLGICQKSFSHYIITIGEMAERSMAAVLKTAVQQCTEGSNPSLSAMLNLFVYNELCVFHDCFPWRIITIGIMTYGSFG